MKHLVALALCIALSGCAAKNYQVHPGAANTFDSQSYDTLLVTNSVIESTKADLAANKFPAAITGNIKTALNGLINAYNAADSAYLIYHAAAIQGGASQAQITNLNAAITNVNSATTTLTQAKAGS